MDERRDRVVDLAASAIVRLAVSEILGRTIPMRLCDWSSGTIFGYQRRVPEIRDDMRRVVR